MTPLLKLNPVWLGILRSKSGEGIGFDCPTCGPKHQLAAYFSNPVDGEQVAPWQEPLWERCGETFETMTIRPSLEYPCFHGWVERGIVFGVQESPLVIFTRKPDGSVGPVALSPEQVLHFADRALVAARQMLGVKE